MLVFSYPEIEPSETEITTGGTRDSASVGPIPPSQSPQTAVEPLAANQTPQVADKPLAAGQMSQAPEEPLAASQ